MADERRCPMCGRPNPPDAEVCQHCGARLTFVGAEPTAGDEAAFSTSWFEEPEPEGRERPPSTDDTAWLRGFFATSEGEAADEEDWEPTGAEGEEAPAPESAPLDARLHAWVGPEAEAAADEGEGQPEAAAEGPAEWVPPWLGAGTGDLEAPQAEAAADEGEGHPEAAAEGPAEWVPPWLGAGTGDLEAPQAEAAAEEGEAAREQPETGWLPPWLDQETANLAENIEVPAEFEAQPEASATPPAPEPQAAPEEERPAPRQTGELALSVEELEALLGESEGEPAAPPEDLLLEEPSPATEEEAAPDLEQAQVPEWLRQAAPGAAGPPPSASVVDEILSRGEGDEEAPEALVGIPDVLPAVPEVARPQVRSRAPLTLRLTRRQEQRAQWLQELLQDEKRPRDLGAAWRTLRFGWLRALVALALMVVAALVVYTPWGARTTPAPHPAWQAAFQAIEALPPQAPVLVVADASWATVPELRPAVEAVFTHLGRKGVQGVEISTVPWGVGLFPGPEGATWHPVGFVPGGVTLMAQLQRALPYALAGGRPWPPEALTAWRGVQGLPQTALVVVITDNPETARLWVEQAGPALSGSSGLVFVSSSQVEPWLLPYLATPGVRGAVLGVEGALAYRQALGLPTESTQRLWQRYQALWVLGGVLMLVATAGAYGLQRVARRRQK